MRLSRQNTILNFSLFTKALVLCCVFGLVACKKDKKEDPKEEIKTTESGVYVVGRDERRIILWVNGKESFITDGSKLANAEGIFVNEKDVYIAGLEFDESTKIQYARVWKNGKPIDIAQGNNSLGEPTPSAKAVYVVGDDVYVLLNFGYDYKNIKYPKAQLWKNGKITALTEGISGWGNGEQFLLSNKNILIRYYDNDIVKFWMNGSVISLPSDAVSVVSDQHFQTNSGQYAAVTSVRDSAGKTIYVATLVKNNALLLRTDGTKKTEATSVFVLGSDVYMTGYEYNPKPLPIIWKNGERTNFGDGTSYKIANAVFVK